MAKQTSNSGSAFLKKVGTAFFQAHEKHKDDDTRFSNAGELPAGLDGIAKLVEVKFDTYKKGDNEGEFFFYAAGVVVSPSEFKDKNGNLLRVEGLRTSIIEPMHETPTKTRKTIEDHTDWVYNELRKLGVDTSAITPETLESTLEALKEADIYFRFRTWQGTKKSPGEQGYNEKYDGPNAPEPRVNHQWNGQVSYTPSDDNSGVEDNTAPAVKSPPTKAAPPKAPAKAPTKPAPEPEPEESEADDVDTNLEAANDGSEEATVWLQAKAVAAGYTEEEVDSAPNWEAVVEMIRNPKEEEAPDEAEEEEAAPAEPEVGNVYYYTPAGNDPKTKKPYKKPIEVEVTKYDKKTKQASIKSMADPKKTWDKVKAADLVEI